MRRRSGLALIAGAALALGLPGASARPGAQGLLGAFRWRGTGAQFGGFSALHVWPGGVRFLAITDRAHWVQGQVRRDADGRITGVEAGAPRPLLATRPGPLAEGRTDAEGIAVGPEGTVYISFEGPGTARVLAYDRIDGPARNLPVPPEFRRLQLNSALEALAVGPDGSLYTLPERSGRLDRPFPVWRFRDGAWTQPFALPRRGPWLAVGADIGPDGRFYLLERDLRGLAGFAMRLRRFRLTGDGVADEVMLIETEAGLHDNLEGLSVWRDGGGGLVATMVSDDNFRFFQRTEIVEYRLPD